MFSKPAKILPSRHQQDISKYYVLGHTIGTGTWGLVRECVDRRSGERLACKSIRKKDLKSFNDEEDVRREIDIMQKLDGHPNVAALRGVYEDTYEVQLVMELYELGDLFEYIRGARRLKEDVAAPIFRQIVEAVAHCHAHGVVHRDLKPENVFLTRPAGPGNRRTAKDYGVKLGDFGLSVELGQPVAYSLVGSPFYMAPEVLKRAPVAPEADIWSLGVSLYVALSGCLPFPGSCNAKVFHAILETEANFELAPWPSVSSAAKGLIRRMMSKTPADRPSAQEILQDPWLRSYGHDCPHESGQQAALATTAAVTSSTTCTFGSTAEPFQRNQCEASLRDSQGATSVLGGDSVSAKVSPPSVHNSERSLCDQLDQSFPKMESDASHEDEKLHVPAVEQLQKFTRRPPAAHQLAIPRPAAATIAMSLKRPDEPSSPGSGVSGATTLTSPGKRMRGPAEDPVNSSKKPTLMVNSEAECHRVTPSALTFSKQPVCQPAATVSHWQENTRSTSCQKDAGGGSEVECVGSKAGNPFEFWKAPLACTSWFFWQSEEPNECSEVNSELGQIENKALQEDLGHKQQVITLLFEPTWCNRSSGLEPGIQTSVC